MKNDKDRYQTVYANSICGSCPTAGLHFRRKNVIKRFEIKELIFAELTLHIGLGTFRSIDVEDLSKHKMEAEYFRITDETAQIEIKLSCPIIRYAVGTTSMRSN